MLNREREKDFCYAKNVSTYTVKTIARDSDGEGNSDGVSCREGRSGLLRYEYKCRSFCKRGASGTRGAAGRAHVHVRFPVEDLDSYLPL